MLKLPSEPEFYDFKPLGPAKKKPEEVKESTWTATDKPGIEINAEGKLRTNIPEHENPSWHASQPIPVSKKSSSLEEKTIKWTPELEQEFQEMRGQFALNIETAMFGVLRSDSPTPEKPTSELSQQRNYSTLRQSGKSLIAEMYSRYASGIRSSQSSQEPQKLSGSRPQAVVIDELENVIIPLKAVSWEELPNTVKELFKLERRASAIMRPTWACYHDGNFYYKDIYDQWSVKDALQEDNRDFDWSQ